MRADRLTADEHLRLAKRTESLCNERATSRPIDPAEYADLCIHQPLEQARLNDLD